MSLVGRLLQLALDSGRVLISDAVSSIDTRWRLICHDCSPGDYSGRSAMLRN